MRFLQALLVLLIIASTGGVAFGFQARVVSIPDGDTVEVYKQGEQFKTSIDLYGMKRKGERKGDVSIFHRNRRQG